MLKRTADLSSGMQKRGYFSLGTKKLLDVISFFLFNGGKGKTVDYGETHETTEALSNRPEKSVRPE